ncbi:DUF397 domain-containing protein [Streptantibioticus ferralitis]|uniref:DUF397 domain-containing protein n=1 Tax=Streptantibioticus ferralitis TaxID=236510 RepID=A0ABT5Z1S7_9ACTN|nr:DUF397 domain-containing protein [Streptantibioticus ferralitis]MDF2257785.1 DUF397 domain-containing protein [Streptantibioticus ferralitis]
MSTTPDLSGAEWIKSSYSNGGGGGCVEWAPRAALTSGTVPIRDSKDPHGPALFFSLQAWASFVSAVTAGEFSTA